MEENEVVEQTEEVEVDVSEEDLAAFDDDWDDDLTPDDDGENDLVDDEPTEEAEANDEETSEEEASEEPEQGETGEGNQLFKINYLGKEEELTLEQMTELAQKGRDYDHVRQERDSLKGKTGKQLAFLQKLAEKSGVSVDEQIDLTEAMWLMDEEAEKGNNITETEALLRVQRNRNSEPKEEEDTQGEEEVNPQVKRFLKAYPDVKGDDIPEEVWKMTRDLDGDLLAAYQAYEIKQLKEEKAKKQQEETNNRNKERSTGSLKSAGANRKIDDFDEGWDSE